ncbi:hypothetical protein PLESTB_000370800 [Pleodorina starrii]|uniref:Rab-GAP TBC domain-containing protein n=1 Tax=Pleodorina starrii TaxID=330485 RepID=A0A9W6BEP3_9CHLO|nr:hypothetical protein PLESTM_000024100 [Pleodorina starrii]GLC50363.1 hypothetical protein PLESTB_000370800 [Pleodorina starrii]GLC64256.1 hypothetical protein PLESTF_000142000 [Pleodorina starrii]
MADLAVPFLELYADDAQAFAVFRTFMARARQNFLPGMHSVQRQMRLLGTALQRVDSQLHRHLAATGAGSYVFAFQMLLLQLRREVSLPDTFTLWERMWASEELLTAARREQRQLQHQRQRRGRSALRGLRWRPASTTAEAASQQGGPTGAAAAEPPAPPPSGGGAAEAEGGLQQGQGVAPAPARGVPEAPATEADGGAERVDLCVYVVAAALRAQRRALLGCHSMEEVVQFVNRFPPPGNVVALVRDAERIYRACEEGDGGAAVGPLRILSGCWRPHQQPLPATAGGSQAWAAPP